MHNAYEAVIRGLEEREVTAATDRMLSDLGAESACPAAGRPALRRALAYLSPQPATDPTPVGRIARLVQRKELAAAELDAWVERFVDVVFAAPELLAPPAERRGSA